MPAHPVSEVSALRAVAVQVAKVLPHAQRNGLNVVALDAALAALRRATPYGGPTDVSAEVATLRLRFAEIVRVTNTDATHASKTEECARIANAALNRDPISHPTGRR